MKPRGPWAVYVLECADGTLYTGITTDVSRRLAEHNGSAKGAKYTRTRRPVALKYEERFKTRGEAARREWELKQLSRAEKSTLIQAAARD